MVTKFTSIPDPGQTLDGLRVTVLALRDTVRVLVKNAPLSTDDTGYATTLHVNKSIAAALHQTSVANNAAASAKSDVTALSATVAGQGQDIDTLQGDVNALLQQLSVGYVLTGSAAGGTLTAGGVSNLAAQLGLAVPVGMLAGLIGTAQIAPDSVSQIATNKTAGNLATITLNLPQAAKGIIFASFTGPQAPTPGGTGQLYINDGADHSVMSLGVTSSGDVMPVSGVIFRPIPAGTTTITARAEFTTGPTSLNGVALTALALML